MSWHVLKLDLNSARWMPKLVSIDAQSYPALTSQSLRVIIGPLQDNWPLFHYVIRISGILPYNRNVGLPIPLSDVWKTLQGVNCYRRSGTSTNGHPSTIYPSFHLHLFSSQLSKNTRPWWALNLSPQYDHVILVSGSDSSQLDIIWMSNCQRDSRAKTRGWRGGSIIEPWVDGKKFECL